MKKILNNLLIISLLFSNYKANGQVGFLGKKNSIDIDILNPAFGGINTSYKYTFTKRTSAFITVGFMKRHVDTLNSTPYLNEYIPAADFKGFKGGCGLLWNFNEAGMNMPLGYYAGFSIDIIKGTLVNTIPKFQIITATYGNLTYYNNLTLKYSFKVSSINYNFHTGKNIYLLKNICLDASVNFGLNYSKYTATANNPPLVSSRYLVGYTLYKNEDYSKSEGFNTTANLYPKVFYSYIHNEQGSHLTDNSLYNKTTYKVIRTLRPIFMPQIKVSYLF